MDKMIKNTEHRLCQINSFMGTCDTCQAPLYYPEEITVVVLREQYDRLVVAPIDLFSCPRCRTLLGTIDVYKDLAYSHAVSAAV